MAILDVFEVSSACATCGRCLLVGGHRQGAEWDASSCVNAELALVGSFTLPSLTGTTTLVRILSSHLEDGGAKPRRDAVVCPERVARDALKPCPVRAE